MFDWLLAWWSANGIPFLIGSTLWLAAGLTAAKLARAPVARQRIAESTIWGIGAWLVLSSVTPIEQSQPASIVEAPAITSTSLPPSFTITDALPIEATSPITHTATPAVEILDVLGVLFALGFVVTLCYTLLGAMLVRRIVRRGVVAPTEVLELARSLPLAPRRVRIVSSPAATRPFCCGLLHARIVLPKPIADSKDGNLVRSILLHEFAHIAQRDLRGNALFACAASLLYWNPLFHRLRREARLCAEVVADDLAAARVGKTTYVRQLVALASSSPALPRPLASALPVVDSQSEFFRRMNMLLTRQERVSARCTLFTTITRCLGTIVLAATASMAWTATIVAQDPSPEAEHVTPPKQEKTEKPENTGKPEPVASQLALKFEFEEDAQLGAVLTKLATLGFAIQKLEVAPPKKGAVRVAWLAIGVKSPRDAMRTLRTPEFLKPVSLLSVAMVKPTKSSEVDRNAIRHAASRVRFAFENEDVKKVVDAIAKITGSNIVLPPSLSGKVTLRVRDVPVFEALETAVRQLGHTVVEEDLGILRVVKVPAKADR
ncbi:MAG: hypothetical protein KDC95_18835 [Planctomycetes bacterium]|nr:hypothetical protein [Planctomycetota bacterium]